MLLLCGIPSERPMEYIAARASESGIPVVYWNQREFRKLEIQFQINNANEVKGSLTINKQPYNLDDFSGIFLRTLSENHLPEMKSLEPDHEDYLHCCRLHSLLYSWCEITPAVVMNRVSSMGSNSSKPYQASIIQQYGFKIPPTIITNDTEDVLEFVDRYKKVIYKSISGVRSIIQVLKKSDYERLNDIQYCPTQFQAYIEGTDYRVHVVGKKTFVTKIITNGIDYRYTARDDNGWTQLECSTLPDHVLASCLELSHGLGMTLSGIDLRMTPAEEVYCFEVNPCPGFSYYEAHTNQPISLEIVRTLAGRVQ